MKRALVALSLVACAGAPAAPPAPAPAPTRAPAPSPASASASAPAPPAASLPPATQDPPAKADAKSLPRATRERAGAAVCVVGKPADIAKASPDPSFFLSEPSGVGFGPAGGLVVWQSTDKNEASVRPIDKDGQPTGPVKTFPAPGHLYVRRVIGFDGGFALVAAVESPYAGAYLFLLRPDGSVLAPPKRIVAEDFFVDSYDVSDAVGNRFVVFGMPNGARQTTTSHATLVAVDASGGVRLRDVDVPAARDAKGPPSPAFALGLEHWAIGVTLASGGALLVADGKTIPVTGFDAKDYTRWAIGWIKEGSTLGAAWATGDLRAPKQVYATLSVDGKLTASDEHTVRAALDAPIEMTTIGGALPTNALRGTVIGEGFPDTPMKAVLGSGMHTVPAWAGDRFVIGYGSEDKPRMIRLVSLRCGS